MTNDQTKTIATAGKLHLLDLAGLKSQMGERWARMADPVECFFEGAVRRNLEAKVFGGGAVLPGFTVNNVGQRNGRFVLDYLKAEDIAVAAQDLLDIYPRRVHYFPRSGRVMVRRLPSANEPDVLASESCVKKPRSSPKAITATPASTATPKMLRIQTSAPKERLRAAKTRPPASSTTAKEVAAPTA